MKKKNKKSKKVSFTLICLVFLIVIFTNIVSEKLCVAAERWDKKVVEDVVLWWPLVEEYNVAESVKKDNWSLKKSKLESIVNTQKKSEYSDDILLSIGCGVAVWEGDYDQAVKIFESVGEKFPNGKTILSYWMPSGDYSFDQLWLKWAPGIVSVHESGKLKWVKTFPEETINLSAKEKAVLQYFKHLEKYPQYTRDLALLNIAQIRIGQEKYDDAIELLTGFIKRTKTRFTQVCIEDNEAANLPYGQYVIGLKRFELNGYELLLSALEIKGEYEKAISYGNDLIEITKSSCNIRCENIYEQMGHLYEKSAKNGISSDAVDCYNMALNSNLKKIEKISELNKISGGNWENLPTQKWERKIETLKKRIAAAGGTESFGGNEIESIKQKHYLEDSDVNQIDQISTLLKDIYMGKGKFVEAEERRKAVYEVKKKFLEKVEQYEEQNKNEENINLRRSVAIGMVQLAINEPDIENRKAIIDELQTVANVAPEMVTNKSVLEDEQVRNSTDQLIMQIAGKEIGEAVPHPESNLADMPDDALIYASQYLYRDDYPKQGKYTLINALAFTENPILYDVFADIIKNNNDKKLVKLAVSGVRRMIENSNIDTEGFIRPKNK